MIEKSPQRESTDLTVAIMAGGKSSRMGTDKSFVPILGTPMIEHVISSTFGLGSETIIITNRPNHYTYLGHPVFEDRIQGKGPLGGLYTALSRSSNCAVLIVACDMPWLNRPLLEYMISIKDQADAVIPKWQGYPEPLHAVYSKECLPAVQDSIRANKLRMISFLPMIRVRFLEDEEILQFDKVGRSFANINSPDELQMAQGDA